MNKNEMTTTELNLMLIEANENTNGAFENIVKYESDIFWCDLELREASPQDIANMVAYGSYKPYHEFIGFDGYGNLESMTEEDYRQELLDYFEEYSEEV
ncbi:hypothetical protein LMHOCYYV_CDS0014 [Staphylococcus phage PG-2021_4]